MQTHSKVYDSYPQAEQVVRELEASGVPSQDISIVANRSVDNRNGDARDESTPTATGAGVGVGAAVGGGAGLLAGLGLMAIPGLGPVVAAGWLAATALGAVAGTATGGLIGALVGSGVSETEAHTYAESIRRGGTLVTVKSDVPNVETIMARHKPIDPVARRNEYQQSGWKEFDPKAPEHRPTQAEIDRIRRP